MVMAPDASTRFRFGDHAALVDQLFRPPTRQIELPELRKVGHAVAVFQGGKLGSQILPGFFRFFARDRVLEKTAVLRQLELVDTVIHAGHPQQPCAFG